MLGVKANPLFMGQEILVKFKGLVSWAHLKFSQSLLSAKETYCDETVIQPQISSWAVTARNGECSFCTVWKMWGRSGCSEQRRPATEVGDKGLWQPRAACSLSREESQKQEDQRIQCC